MSSTAPSPITRGQKKKLLALLPEDRLLFSPEKTAVYGVDAGRKKALPGAVARPQNLDEVQKLLGWAQQEGIPLHPRARGTNAVGGCVPESGGLVVSCLDMCGILEVNEKDYSVCVEPGVVTGELQKYLEGKGLFYPPDPASARFCTVGGNVVTNAGGMRAVKYGVTRDYVLGLEAVLPGGKILRTGGNCHKDVVGLDLTSLFVGSEGGLGFITRIWLKVLPLPQYTSSLLAVFDSLKEALEGVDTILSRGILPVGMEVIPHAVLECLHAMGGVDLPRDAGAVLLVRVDGNEAGVRSDLDRIERGLERAQTWVAGPAEEDRLWEPRRMISQASYRLKPDKISEDVTVPRGMVADYVHGADKIGRKSGLPVLVFGHAGDGNMHTNIMYDATRAEECSLAGHVREDILRLVLDLEGTISGEHGIGQAKREYLSWQLDPVQREYMQRIKKAFDPQGIMNPVVRF